MGKKSQSSSTDILSSAPSSSPSTPTPTPTLHKTKGTSDFSALEFVLRLLILGLICFLAFVTRLFSVLRFESVIHEFDPYFNFRSTQYLVTEGVYNFINYFDPRSWYPMGRLVGETVYPGLMLTAGLLHYILQLVNLPVDIRNICVLLAPFFACLTSLATYALTFEVSNDKAASLLAAAFISIIPGYISRSVAGSYDNEAIAIFAMVFAFYTWLRAVNTGSLSAAVLCSLAYFYMVAAWGGYIFVINLIPLHVLVLILCGRFSLRLYIAYSLVYVLGTLMSMQVSFVGFNPVRSGDHMPALGMFIFIQVYALVRWLRTTLDENNWRIIVRFTLLLGLAAFMMGVLLTGLLFTGRLYALLDPTYAKNNIPIIASVSEHQPITWSTYVFDLHLVILFIPIGLYCLFYRYRSDSGIFIALYCLTSLYFSSSMVRLVLVLSPIACVVSAIGLSRLLKVYMKILSGTKNSSSSSSDPTQRKKTVPPREIGLLMVVAITFILAIYVFHSIWITSEAYSSPSIVLQARDRTGGQIIFDDFREAYYWLRHNTPEDSRIMSWWDYGYQISAMANRTVIVDNNTRNNSHIAQVGTAFASTEEDAIPIMRELQVDYVLVIFGGYIGYSSDDINKFLWMVRIGGGVNPRIKEPDYYSPVDGSYSISDTASPNMKNCLMYKLCYYLFDQVVTNSKNSPGYDLVRQQVVGQKNIKLKYLKEVFTSEHWMVRIYKVNPPSARFGDHHQKRISKRRPIVRQRTRPTKPVRNF